MRNFFLTTLFFLISICTYGQISYDKGYFIDNENVRKECLIKNEGWKNNPREFLFKFEETGEPKKGDIQSVKEFGIYGFCAFVRSKVKIDRSNVLLSELGNDKEPIWSQEELFIKVLVKGKATLYIYEETNLERYFYSLSDSSINQLVYKQYLVDRSVADNNRFQQQLWTDVKCPDQKMEYFEKIPYAKRDLQKQFLSYNKCFGDTSWLPEKITKKNFFNLKIAPGFNLVSSSTSNSAPNSSYPMPTVTFDKKISFSFGIESEFILPYNRNKWGVLIEPCYQQYNAEKIVNQNKVKISFKSVEMLIGLRHYFFLNKSKAFINVHYSPYTLKLYNNSYYGNYTKLNINPKGFFAIGGGVEYNRLSMELRHYLNRNLISNSLYWSADYSSLSLIIGYKLISAKN